MNDDFLGPIPVNRLGKTIQCPRHFRTEGTGGLGFQERQRPWSRGDYEIHLQTLLVPKAEQFAAQPPIHLGLNDFRRDESFKQRPVERRAGYEGW